MADKNVTREVTTGVGTFSFPRVFKSTAGTKDDGVTTVYDIQILLPKTDTENNKTILRAIKEVGESRWGANWRKMRQPLRDGDAEKDELTEDGVTTKGEKYPERLGCYFINARSSKPVGVYGRDLTPINDESEIYGGCKGRISIGFYSYSQSGNHGIGAGLNGVQKVSDGEAFGGGRPSVESMFDALDDEEGDDMFTDSDSEPEPVKPAKKATAKKAAAKPAPDPEPEDLEPEADSDAEDPFADLDDEI